MKYHDLVLDAGLEQKALSLGYERIIKPGKNIVQEKDYNKLVEKTRPGTLLLDPLNARRTLVDPVLAKKARDKNAGIVLTLSSLLENRRMYRVSWLRNMRQTISVCKKYNAEIMLATGAKEPEQLKTPMMLEATLQTLGLTPPQARWACTNAWEKILK